MYEHIFFSIHMHMHEYIYIHISHNIKFTEGVVKFFEDKHIPPSSGIYMDGYTRVCMYIYMYVYIYIYMSHNN
jgi:hypothetical protein